METVLLVVACGLGMLLVERRKPGRVFPDVPGWWPRALLLTAVQAAVAFIATLTWDRWIPQATIWHPGGHGLISDALIGYVAITFFYYWWHRARHEIAFLWRTLHSVHHSASRVELVTSFYKHPAEVLANGVLSSVILYLFVGLDPASASLASTLTGLAELFYHWNVRTPYWLGFVIQRPESHQVHHERDRHTGNFSDLPLWDILFGTFHNPRGVPDHCGFGPSEEQRLAAPLLQWIPAMALIAIGCVQMTGDLSGRAEVRAAGLATHASPAPKVFTSQGGFETFSSRFFIDWTDTAGVSHALELTPATYRALRGPYNRRNAYGAALSYAPVLVANERTRPMLDSAMHHAFCGDAPLLTELGIPPAEVRYPLHVRLEPRHSAIRDERWQTVFAVTCGRPFEKEE